MITIVMKMIEILLHIFPVYLKDVVISPCKIDKVIVCLPLIEVLQISSLYFTNQMILQNRFISTKPFFLHQNTLYHEIFLLLLFSTRVLLSKENQSSAFSTKVHLCKLAFLQPFRKQRYKKWYLMGLHGVFRYERGLLLQIVLVKFFIDSLYKHLCLFQLPFA